MQSLTGARFRIHDRGPETVQDIDWTLSNPSDGLPLVRSGNIKAYAVTAPSRAAIAPDIPTVDEATLPGFYIWSWSGI